MNNIQGEFIQFKPGTYEFSRILIRRFDPLYVKIENYWWIINNTYFTEQEFLSFINQNNLWPSTDTIETLKKLVYKPLYYDFYSHFVINEFNLIHDIKNLIKQQLINL
jgi:hypothetical protein